jgi:hypothetical protein
MTCLSDVLDGKQLPFVTDPRLRQLGHDAGPLVAGRDPAATVSTGVSGVIRAST